MAVVYNMSKTRFNLLQTDNSSSYSNLKGTSKLFVFWYLIILLTQLAQHYGRQPGKLKTYGCQYELRFG